MQRPRRQFASELDLIRDPDVRDVATYLLSLAPDHYSEVPASHSGKFHPPDERGPGGQIIHTKRVVALAAELARPFRLTGEQCDILIAAALCHDLAKAGWAVKPAPGSCRGHELALWKRTKDAVDDDDTLYEAVVGTAVWHSGQWGPTEEKVPEFMLQHRDLGAILHLADYLASRTYLGFDPEQAHRERATD